MDNVTLTKNSPHYDLNQFPTTNSKKNKPKLFLPMFLLTSLQILGQTVDDYNSAYQSVISENRSDYNTNNLRNKNTSVVSIDSGNSISTSNKTWNGLTSDWFAATNWIPNGVPTASDSVSITNTGLSPIICGNTVAKAYNIVVAPNGKLEIASNGILEVTDFINVNTNGIFNIKNSGSLIQINNVNNIGSIKMERIAFVDSSDYVYWSSPVTGFSAANISLTSNNANLYKWIPTIPGNGIGGFGNWASAIETMLIGKGYIEKGLNNAPLNSPINFTTIFTGTPNNGNINTPISRGIYNILETYPSPLSPISTIKDDDNWNLLGNPYPSAISANAFLTANASNIMGFVKIWRHGIAPNTGGVDPFYGSYAYNYEISDYLTYNLSGPSSPSGFDGFIGAGQSFFVLMNPLSELTTTTAVFNNSMRSSSYRNDQFFKTATTNINEFPEGKIWIDLVSSTSSNSTLIAYINGATNQKDPKYDAQLDLKSNFCIYSLLEGYDRNIIQGRSVPFNQNDQIPLALKVPTFGSYTIFIKKIEGILNNQNIYLIDNELNIIHNLRAMPYTFSADQGETLNRFTLRYTNQILSTDENMYTNQVTIFTKDYINVKSFDQSINEITVYDILGKKLLDEKNMNQKEIILTALKPTNGILIIKVKLENETIMTNKVSY